MCGRGSERDEESYGAGAGGGEEEGGEVGFLLRRPSFPPHSISSFVYVLQTYLPTYLPINHTNTPDLTERGSKTSYAAGSRIGEGEDTRRPWFPTELVPRHRDRMSDGWRDASREMGGNSCLLDGARGPRREGARLKPPLELKC